MKVLFKTTGVFSDNARSGLYQIKIKYFPATHLSPEDMDIMTCKSMSRVGLGVMYLPEGDIGF